MNENGKVAFGKSRSRAVATSSVPGLEFEGDSEGRENVNINRWKAPRGALDAVSYWMLSG